MVAEAGESASDGGGGSVNGSGVPGRDRMSAVRKS